VASTDTFTTESMILPNTRGADAIEDAGVDAIIDLTLKAKIWATGGLARPERNIHRPLKGRQWRSCHH
jgi:hypothetical protein